jgi:hypothetical protein
LRQTHLALIVVILLIAAALRIVGLSFGQPDPAYAPEDTALNTIHANTPLHPDEFLFIQRPLRMLLTGELNPKFFHNPSFLINTNLAVFWLTGEHQRLSWEGREAIGARRAAPFRLYLTGRTFSALGGVLAVAATYAAARYLTDRRGQIAAALIVAVSLPMVQHAHYTTTSSLAAGFVMVCVWASLSALHRWRWWMFALAGIAAGLAAGSRYNAAAVSLVVFFAGWVLLYRERTLRRVMSVGIGWILFPLVFLITTPHVIADTAFFLEEFRFITNQYIGDDPSTLNTAPLIGLWYEYRYLLLYALGLPAALAAFAGIGIGLRQVKTRLAAILLLSYLLPYSYVVLRTIRPLGADQMLVPIIPVFALLSGIGFAALTVRTPQRIRLALLIALIALPLGLTLPVVRQFATPDTRYDVQAWVHANIPAGSHVHLDGPYNVPLDATVYEWTQTYGGGDLPTVDDLRADGVDYVIVSDAWYQHYTRTGYVDPAEVERIAAHLTAYEDELERVYAVPRPNLPGNREAMHSASYWHHPALVVYRVGESRS